MQCKSKSKPSWTTLSSSSWQAVADRRLIQPLNHPTQVQNGALRVLICTCCHQTVQQKWRPQITTPHYTHRPISPHTRLTSPSPLSLCWTDYIPCHTFSYTVFLLYIILYHRYHIIFDNLFYSVLHCCTILYIMLYYINTLQLILCLISHTIS